MCSLTGTSDLSNLLQKPFILCEKEFHKNISSIKESTKSPAVDVKTVALAAIKLISAAFLIVLSFVPYLAGKLVATVLSPKNDSTDLRPIRDQVFQSEGSAAFLKDGFADTKTGKGRSWAEFRGSCG